MSKSATLTLMMQILWLNFLYIHRCQFHIIFCHNSYCEKFHLEVQLDLVYRTSGPVCRDRMYLILKFKMTPQNRWCKIINVIDYRPSPSYHTLFKSTSKLLVEKISRTIFQSPFKTCGSIYMRGDLLKSKMSRCQYHKKPEIISARLKFLLDKLVYID